MLERWINPDGFTHVRQDPRFVGICQLARTVNAIREFDEIARGAGENDRRRIVCFTTTLALVHEALTNLCRALGRDWKDDDAYRFGFGVLLRSNDVRDFQARYLKALRNKAAFHSDSELVQAGLETLPPGVAFGFGRSRLGTTEDAFFLGAELLIWRAVFSDAETVEGFSQEFEKAARNLVGLVGKFLEAADLLLMHALDELGFETRSIDG